MSDFQKRNIARPGDRDLNGASSNGRGAASATSLILDILNKFAHFKYGVEIDGQLTVNDVTYLAQLLTAAAGAVVTGGLYADTAVVSGAIEGNTITSLTDMLTTNWHYFGDVDVVNEYFRIGVVNEALVTQKLTDVATWTNVGGSMTYKEIVVTGQSAGEINLSSATWNISKAWIDSFTVSVSSGDVTDYNIEVHEDDTFTGDPRYKVESILTDWEDETEWSYIDRDNSNEVHLKIIENTGTGTYDIIIRGIELT